MSYILDALKKADADRLLGTLPGIDSAPPVQRPDRHSLGGWHWKAAAAFLLAMSLVLGYVALNQRSGPIALPPAAVVTTSVSPAPGVPLAGLNRSSGAGPIAPSRPDAETAHAIPAMKTGAAANVSNTLPTKQATDVPLPPALPKLPKRLASPGNQSTKKTPVTKDLQGLSVTSNRAALPAMPDSMTFAQLPSEIQHELPPMAISGTMYSTVPADRLLLIDKRMLHEGDEIAPGVILEGVLPKGARLRYKNFVFQVFY